MNPLAMSLVALLTGCAGEAPAPSAPAPAATTPSTPVVPASLPQVSPAAMAPAHLGLGRPATAEQVAAWDIDVRPDGKGLPPGKGTVEEGRALYATQCVMCHGAKGEGASAPKLVGVEPSTGFGEDWKDHPRTIGNWWPYATTVFDYVRRAMPQYAPGSLNDDQVYALTAFLLEENGIVGADFVADAKSLPTVKMRTKVTFVQDDREGATRVK